MTRIVSAATRISTAAQALVLIITHTGKDENRGARGHSSLRAAADAEFYVHGRRDETRIFEVTKMRDGSDQLKLGFRLDPVELKDSETGAVRSVPVVVPIPLGALPSKTSPRPGTWEAIVLQALATAENGFESAELPGVPRKTLLNYASDLYRGEKGDLPARWRDTAAHALTALVRRGVLREERGHLSRPPP